MRCTLVRLESGREKYHPLQGWHWLMHTRSSNGSSCRDQGSWSGNEIWGCGAAVMVKVLSFSFLNWRWQLQEKPWSLGVAPVFSSCCPSCNFVPTYFPTLSPILLEIPRVVSISCAYFMTYEVLLYTISLGYSLTIAGLSHSFAIG